MLCLIEWTFASYMGISNSLPVTGYIKMVDVWMIAIMSYPFLIIVLQCSLEVKRNYFFSRGSDLTTPNVCLSVSPSVSQQFVKLYRIDYNSL